MKAHEILQAGIQHMQDRASTYDKPEGERSMPVTVDAFNSITGHELTAEQGWIFMAILKLVRSQQGEHRTDNYEDGAAYVALAGEQASVDRLWGPIFEAAGRALRESGEIDERDSSPTPKPQWCGCETPVIDADVAWEGSPSCSACGRDVFECAWCHHRSTVTSPDFGERCGGCSRKVTA